jgi:hypothetical protein
VAPAVFAKDDQGRITIRATRVEGLDLDGRLDEQVYRTVPPIEHFIQQEPNEGQEATERTQAWLFFDDEYFYVSVRSFDSAPERLVANELRRDNFNIFQNDNITISIDPLYTRRSGVFFQTNALSAQRDQEVQDERSNNNDWNTIWRTRSRILEDGWSMEFAIPYSSLRFRAAGPQVWGFNLRRVIRWKNEHVSIAPIPASATARAMYKFDIMATVVGVETPTVRRPLDFKPYAIAASTTNLAAATPFRNDPTADAGFDVKYSLTNSLVADVTFRTDFAQVEEDQQQVNLTRFSLFFPEKRDFFLEGQGLFSFAGGQGGRGGGGGGPTPVVFYTRRIGLGPSGEVPIIAGGRVAGRAGKFGIGLLSIQTESGESDASDASTNFSVIRLRRDVLRRSNVGFIATRRTPGDGLANMVLGADGNFWFFNNLTVTGYFAASDTEGAKAPSLQPSPTEGAKAPSLQPSLTEGAEAPSLQSSLHRRSSYRGEFDYQPDQYGFRYEHLLVGSGFQPEMGFLRRQAFRRNFVSGRVSPRPATGPVRRHVFEAELDYITGSDDGALETREAQASYTAELRGNDEFGLTYTRSYEVLREGFNVVPGRPIPAGAYHFADVGARYQFGAQRRVSGTLSASTGSFYDGTNSSVGYNGNVELSSRFKLEPGLSVNWIDIPAGRFRTAVTSVRASYMFSPYMALSTLVQHNSTGATLGSSVRFRWEYAPGSDVFVVYSDGRDTRIGDRFPGLVNRTFVVKATRLLRF